MNSIIDFQKIELIIFDFDGVIVDSERLHNQVLADLLKEMFGLSFSLEKMYDTFVGLSTKHCHSMIENMIGEKIPPELLERQEIETELALKEHLVETNGIKQVLNSLTIPYSIASNSFRQRIDVSLEKCGLSSFFDNNIFTIEDVSQGKPSPELYLHAAKQMGSIDPKHCLVIEDSPAGVKSGYTAGMTVFGFCELMPKSKLIDAGAHHTFKHMHQLFEEIKNYQRLQFLHTYL